MEIVRFIHSEPQRNNGMDLEGNFSRHNLQSDLPFGYGRHPGSKAGVPTDGIEIKRLRNLSNLSQQALAERVGISKGMVSLVESTGKPMSRPTLNRLANALGVQPDTLQADPDWKEKHLKRNNDPLSKAIRSLNQALAEVDLGSRDTRLMAQELQALLNVGNRLAIAIEMRSHTKE